MKVDDIYTLSRFNAVQTTSLDELNNSSIKASRDNSIFWFEDDSKVYIDVYLRYALLDELIENGIIINSINILYHLNRMAILQLLMTI
jgi:hypothetical protein